MFNIIYTFVMLSDLIQVSFLFNKMNNKLFIDSGSYLSFFCWVVGWYWRDNYNGNTSDQELYYQSINGWSDKYYVQN